VEPKSALPVIEILTPIWQRLFQKSTIGAEENFFDLGGSALLAANLFDEIERVFGRRLPPEIICRAPTILALADLLEKPVLPHFPPLVLLKAGMEEPPIFVTHGVGGNVLDLLPVARRIDSGHAILGMQARGTSETEQPFERIEDIAQFFLDAIQELQPRGPYFLIGYSLGGLVTMEMAQRLTVKGEKVALLAMLESYPHKRYLSPKERLRLFIRVVTYHAKTILRLPIRQAVAYLTNSAVRLSYSSGDKSGTTQSQPPVGGYYAATRDRLRGAGYLALKRYRPRFYCGKINFVRAEINQLFPDNPAAVWGHLAHRFGMDSVPGDHSGIITTHFDRLAFVLSRYLQEAFSRK
jgi:thioesterase domain-containing protein